MNIEQKINDYKIENQNKSIIGQINESFWTEIDSISNKSLDERADLYKKEKKTFLESIKMNFLELKLSLLGPDFKNFKKELDDLKNGIDTPTTTSTDVYSADTSGDDNVDTSSENAVDNLDVGEAWSKIVSIIETQRNNNKAQAFMREVLNKNKFSCWTWTNAVYTLAWFPMWKRNVIYQDGAHYAPKWDQTWTQPALRRKLKRWDWLYVHNKNWVDKNWDHSVIFLWWENWVVGKAKTASYPWSWNKVSFKTYDLDENPIRYISRPMAA